jgi:zinc transport system permease protein
MITDLFTYGFVVRALEAGVVVAAIAPLIGMFLVLRRYALLADTLAHVSLTGVALGLLIGVNPLLTAIAVSGIAAVSIERLRETGRVYGDTALSLFLSGSLAVALILISFAHGFNTSLFQYLFGSILTVRPADVAMIAVLGTVIAVFMLVAYRALLYLSFDEEAARVSTLPSRTITIAFIALAATAIVLSIPVVGMLLVSALMVIPVVAAMQLRLGFGPTLIVAEIISVSATVFGILTSFVLDLAPGATIVISMLAIFLGILGVTRRRRPVRSV